MKKIGTLENRLDMGSCFGTDEHIGLCFDEDERRLCRRGTDPLGSFESVQLSNYDHYYMGWMSADKSEYLKSLFLIKYHKSY